MEQNKAMMDANFLRILVDTVMVIRISKRTDMFEKISSAFVKLKGRLTDEHIFALIKGTNLDGVIIRIIISTGCLTPDGAIGLLEQNLFDEALCECALEAYPGDEFAKNLIDRAGKSYSRKLLRIIESSPGISQDLKLKIAIEYDLHPFLCRKDASDAAIKMLDDLCMA